MQRHHPPDRPCSRVTADQFKLHDKEYLVPVDFHSGFIEVRQLQEINSCSVIKFFKQQFSRYRIPDTLVMDTDWGQFTSHEFHQFSRDWEFLHVSSSQHQHRANGKVESVFKAWVMVLDQRNTPTKSLGTSPTQRLMSPRTRTLLPTATYLLHPNVPENALPATYQK